MQQLVYKSNANSIDELKQLVNGTWQDLQQTVNCMMPQIHIVDRVQVWTVERPEVRTDKFECLQL